MTETNVRDLTNKEKNYILSRFSDDKGLSNDILRVLEQIKVPDEVDMSHIKKIRKKIETFLDEGAPRKLTNKELDDIVSIIPMTPSPVKSVSVFYTEMIRERIRKQLSSQKYLVKDGTLTMIKKVIREAYLRSVVPAGSSVGSTGGMAISGQITQAMLDSIHSSGKKNDKEENFKRLEALIEVKKEPDELDYTVHFKDKNLVPEEIKLIGDMLKGITVGDFINGKEILKDIPEEDWRYYRNHAIIYGAKNSIDPSTIKNRFLRLSIDINKCLMYNTSIEDIVHVIENNTKDDDFENTVICVGGPLDQGFIDIHGNQDYIQYSVTKFSNLGQRIGECSDIKKDKKDTGQEFLDQGISDLEIDEMTGIFLKIILGDCLEEMKIKGINGITNVESSEPVSMDEVFIQSRISSETEIEKFSEPPYSFELDDISRLWNVKITKSAIYFKGVSFEKIRETFDACGMEIIEDKLENDHSMVIMMPKKRDDKFFKDNKSEYIYQKIDGKYMDVRQEPLKEVSDRDYKPKVRLANLRSYEKDVLSRKIVTFSSSKEESFTSFLPKFSRIYRATTYSYATITGKDITRDLFSNKLIDHRFIFPENARAMKRIFGIESARFYLIWKYLSVGFIEKINPVTILLLVDFQTSHGTLIPIRSTDIYKRGDSVLSQISFEKQNMILKNASAFGESDDISSVSSRVMTGRPCRNGTGYVDLTYDPFYINNNDNKYLLEVSEPGKQEKIHTDDVLGPCLNAGVYVLPKDDIDAESVDNPMLLSDRNKKPVVCEKEEIPSPPRSKAPESLRKKSTRKTLPVKGEKVDINKLEDIPDAPEFEEEDFFPTL